MSRTPSSDGASLRIADDDEIEYGKTVGWFIASAVVLFIAVLIAVVVFSGVFDPERLIILAAENVRANVALNP
jgi:hypothetical protein